MTKKNFLLIQLQQEEILAYLTEMINNFVHVEHNNSPQKIFQQIVSIIKRKQNI